MAESFYLKDEDLTKDELKRVIEIVASCTDMTEVYYDTEEEDRSLLRKIFKDRFLPAEQDDE